MKINGHEVEAEAIGKIAGAFGIRHSDECRAANGRGRAFHCRCDFFARIAEHLIEPDEEMEGEAASEAQRYFDEGYRIAWDRLPAVERQEYPHDGR